MGGGRSRGFVGFALATAVLALVPRAARATDDKRAQTLFDEGLSAMEAGRFEQGCPALEESVRLSPLPGALFTLAECEVRWGRFAMALTRYETYLERFERMTPGERAKQRGREKVAASQAAALRGRVAKLIVRVRGAPAGARVTNGDVEIPQSEWGAERNADPGTVTLTLRSASGTALASESVTLLPGARRELLLTAAATPPEARDTSPTATGPAPASREADGPPAWPWVLGGVSVAALAGGAATSVVTLSASKVVDERCRDRVCDAEGLDAVERAKTWGWVATGFLAAGAVGVGVSGYVLLTANRRTAATAAPAAALRVSGPGLELRGTF